MCGSRISIMALPPNKQKCLALLTWQAASSKKHLTQTFRNFSLKSGSFDKDTPTNHHTQSLSSDLFLHFGEGPHSTVVRARDTAQDTHLQTRLPRTTANAS